MERSFLDKVENSYLKGKNSNPQFKEAIDFIRTSSEKADKKLRENKKEKEDVILR